MPSVKEAMQDLQDNVDFEARCHYRVVDYTNSIAFGRTVGMMLYQTSTRKIDLNLLSGRNHLIIETENKEIPFGTILYILNKKKFRFDGQIYYGWQILCPHAGMFWAYGREFTYCKRLQNNIQKIIT